MDFGTWPQTCSLPSGPDSGAWCLAPGLGWSLGVPMKPRCSCVTEDVGVLGDPGFMWLWSEWPEV